MCSGESKIKDRKHLNLGKHSWKYHQLCKAMLLRLVAGSCRFSCTPVLLSPLSSQVQVTGISSLSPLGQNLLHWQTDSLPLSSLGSPISYTLLVLCNDKTTHTHIFIKELHLDAPSFLSRCEKSPAQMQPLINICVCVVYHYTKLVALPWNLSIFVSYNYKVGLPR